MNNGWKERFINLEKAFVRLGKAVERVKGSDDDILQAGLIQIYEFTFELSWKTLKGYMEAEGYNNLQSPKKTLRQAFQSGYIQDGHMWLKALDDRNKTAHMYNEEIAKEVLKNIIEKYFYIIRDLYFTLRNELDE